MGLCQPKFVKKLNCRFFISRDILIGSVTHVARKLVTWASFNQFIKTANTSTATTVVKSSKHTLDTSDKASTAWRKSKSAVSIRGLQSHPRSKVPRRLLKANQESLSPFLFWRKLKNLKALFSLILTSKRRSKKINKTNELGPA